MMFSCNTIILGVTSSNLQYKNNGAPLFLLLAFSLFCINTQPSVIM